MMTNLNRINKIHISQQLLSTFGVVLDSSRSFARIEVIHMFHKNDNHGFQFSAKLPTGLQRNESWRGSR